MPTQRADDAGRQIRQPWLGAKGARWPWDWTYSEWGLAAAAFTIGGTLLTWAIPSVVVVFFAIRWLADLLSRATSNQKRTYRLVVACLVMLCLMYSLDWRTWVSPLFFPVAIALSFVIPFRAVKLWGRYITWNRPIGYWVRLLFQVAAGPRRKRQQIIDPTPLAMNLDGLGDETDEIKPGRIVTVPRPRIAKPKTKPVVKAKISKAPKRPAKVPMHERSPLKPSATPRNRPRLIERTPQGIRVGKTEYRLEDY
jgi:hypothetical protein